MAVQSAPRVKPRLLNKPILQTAMDEVDRQTGMVKDIHATAAQSRELMLAQGVKPEQNEFSSELIRMRYEE